MPDSFSKRLHPGRVLLGAGIFFALIAGASVLYFLYPVARKYFPSCPFYELLHLYCPGCGSTRAAFYFLHGDIAGVFRSNPIFLPTILLVVLLILNPKRMRRPVIVRTYVILLFLFWFLRNLPWYPFTLLAPSPVPF